MNAPDEQIGAVWKPFFRKFEKWDASQKTKNPLPRAKDMVKALVQDTLAPLLKELGFQKKAHNFWKDNRDHVWVVNVQSSMFNYTWEATFMLNLGVYFPCFAKRAHMSPDERRPKEYQCFWRTRIGEWTFNAWMKKGKVKKTHEEVRKAFLRRALPWFEKHSGVQEARKLARGGRVKDWHDQAGHMMPD